MEAIKRYGAGWMAWTRLVPRGLRRENPARVLDVLASAAKPEGVNGTQLQKAVGMTQSQESRLTYKLTAAGWLRDVPSTDDTRCRLVTTTEAAKSILGELEQSMQDALGGPTGARPTRSTSPRRRQVGGEVPTFFDLLSKQESATSGTLSET